RVEHRRSARPDAYLAGRRPGRNRVVLVDRSVASRARVVSASGGAMATSAAAAARIAASVAGSILVARFLAAWRRRDRRGGAALGSVGPVSRGPAVVRSSDGL
ncbi:MAG: hypothetical protein KJO75_15460, partial [Dactylosporangium sp.]|nr:hypothetical protein [Dactylosporangium sp.]